MITQSEHVLKRFGHWIAFEEPDPSQYFGFIYFIKNLVTEQKYIGKKQYWLKNGRKKSNVTDRTSDKWKQEAWKESNWEEYTSSSKHLNADIKKYGKDNFMFVLMHQWRCKADLHYAEIKEQTQRNVLHEKLDYDESLRQYYNAQIAGMKFIPPTTHSEETKAKLRKILKERGHPMEGKVHPNKGKKLPQCAPKQHASVTKHQITDGIKNRWYSKKKSIPKGWRKGITMKCKSGDDLSDKQREVLKYATARNIEEAHKKLAHKAGFKTYEELVNMIKNKVESGSTGAQLARELGIGKTTVYGIIHS